MIDTALLEKMNKLRANKQKRNHLNDLKEVFDKMERKVAGDRNFSRHWIVVSKRCIRHKTFRELHTIKAKN